MIRTRPRRAASVNLFKFGMSFSAPETYSFPPGSMKSACVSTSQKITDFETIANSPANLHPAAGGVLHAAAHFFEQSFQLFAVTHGVGRPLRIQIAYCFGQARSLL